MATKKRLRGIPVNRDELKKRRSVMLTETAWQHLKTKAKAASISISEVVERLSRGEQDG